MRKVLVMMIFILATMTLVADRLEVKTLETNNGFKIVQGVYDTELNGYCAFDGNGYCVPFSVRNESFNQYDEYIIKGTDPITEKEKDVILIRNPYIDINTKVIVMMVPDYDGVTGIKLADKVFYGVVKEMTVNHNDIQLCFVLDDTTGVEPSDVLVKLEEL